MKRSLHGLIILLFAILFLTCKKNDINIPENTPVPDFQNKIIFSASGFVTDENNNAIEGATVKMGASTTLTDEFGYFSFTDVQVVKHAGVITVKRNGYFNGIRTVTAEEGKPAFVRIKLSPKTRIGNIDAAAGGSVTGANGLSVSLPAQGVVDAGTGVIYTGPVNVFARWLDPSSPDILNTMPGDLRAIDASGSLRLLISYGMAAVELTGSTGQLLQIAPGKKSMLTFPLPASMNATAPATIPLWHFDEEKGLWVEEGHATKNGNTYSGEVGHYSFWNLDLPTQVVNFQARLLNGDGSPLANVFIKISKTDNPLNMGSGFTNSNGYTSGGIPANSNLVFEVYSNVQCTEVAYSQNITSGSSTLDLGEIVVPGQNLAKISGRVENCGFAPLQKGFVVMTLAGIHYRYTLDSSSIFSFSAPLCGLGGQASIVAVDMINNQQSDVLNFSIAAGPNPVGTLRACGINSMEFIEVIVNDSSYVTTSPPDSFVLSGPPTANLLRLDVYYMEDTLLRSRGGLFMDRLGMAVGSVHEVYGATMALGPVWPQNSRAGNFSQARITEYGAVGQFVSGYLDYDVIRPNGELFHKVHCTFRFRRAF